MIEKLEYKQYFGVSTTPSNFKRLEQISIHLFNSIPITEIPNKDDLRYNTFKEALMEQMNYYDMNSDLLDSNGAGGYSLGSYHEGSSNQNKNSKSIDRLSPVAYDILLSSGLIYSGLGRC